MTEWDLMKKASELANKGDQRGVSQLILDNEINGMNRLSAMLLSVFTITKNNVSENIDAAKKLSTLKLERPTIREEFRLNFIKDTIKELFGEE